MSFLFSLIFFFHAFSLNAAAILNSTTSFTPETIPEGAFLLNVPLVSKADWEANPFSQYWHAKHQEEQIDVIKRSGGAFYSCYVRWFDYGHRLYYLCHDTYGWKHYLFIDMNYCIANRYGWLIWQKNGWYKNSCGSCWLENAPWSIPSDPSIWCKCPSGTGTTITSHLELNFMTNVDGVLKCDRLD